MKQRLELTRARRPSSLICVLLTTALACGCGSRVDDAARSTDTGNPPVADSGRIAVRLEGDVIVVRGNRGAVPSGARVRIENEALGAVTSTKADTDGSFDASIEGQAGTRLRVSVEADGETSVLTLQVPEPPAPPPEPSSPNVQDFDAGTTTALPSRDVDWPNVDWARSTWVEFGPSTLGPSGLWMGTGVDETNQVPAVPVEDAPYELDGNDSALHFVSNGVTSGADIYLHTPLPVERMFGGVYFNAKSDAPGGQTVRVTLGGPTAEYWSDVNSGAEWPVWEIELGSEWTKHELTFAELGFDEGNLSPYSDPWGALHFLVGPDQAYDFALFDLVFVNFLE